MRPLLSLIAILIPAMLCAQSWNEFLHLKSNEPVKDGQFGNCVDIDGFQAIVGANGKNGAAYIFEKQKDGNWIQTDKLVPNIIKDSDQFGSSVSLYKNIAVVGAMWYDIKKGENTYKDAGAAFVFEKQSDGSWKEITKLEASDPDESDQFGISVSQNGQDIAIGAIWNDFDTEGKKRRPDAGAIYLFSKANGAWVQKQKVVAEDRKPYEMFGSSMSMLNNKLLVGAYRNGFNSTGKSYLEFAGAAYYFEKGASGLWEQKQKLTPEKRFQNDFFGYSVSLSDKSLIIGAQEHKFDETGANEIEGSGAAYIFNYEGTEWKEAQKLTSMDRQKTGYFGESVSISGDRAVIGSWGQSLDLHGIHSNKLDTSGAAYVFKKKSDGNWAQELKLLPQNRHKGDQFGISVAIDGDYLISGSWGYDVSVNQDTLSWSGSAFMFTICEKPTLIVSSSDEMIISGESVVLSAKGADSIIWSNNVENNVSFVPKGTSYYHVLGRNKNGCYDEADIQVLVKPPFVSEVKPKPIIKPMPIVTNNPKSNFRIIQLENNEMIAANTEEVEQNLSGLTVISNLKYENTNQPIPNVSVLLMDENGFVLKRGKTDSKGIARFEMLDPDKQYEVVIDKNDPLIDAKPMIAGQEISLKSQEFIRMPKGFTLLSQIAFNTSAAPAADVYVLLIDNEGNVLKKGRTDEEGVALFHELEEHKNYQVIIDKNHPSLQVNATHDGQIIEVDSKRIIQNFSRLTLLSRLAYAKTEEPAADIPVMLMDENGVVLKRGSTNSDGYASFVMPDDNQKYTIVIDEEMLRKQTGDVSSDKPFNIDNIYFDFNSSQVRQEAEVVLNDLVKMLKNHPEKEIAIHAHTDALGNEEVNMMIAKMRGEKVKSQLVERGIPSNRIKVNAIGNEKPIASNDLDLGRQLNRRVEFEILN